MPPSRPGSGAPERLVALDVLRGLTMLVLVFGGLGAAHFQNKPGWDWLAGPVRGSDASGFRVWDLLQPAFLFICGAAIPYSLANRQGQSLARKALHVLTRTMILLGIGFYLDAYEMGRFDARHLRLTGPLQQIALAWFLAMLIVPLGVKVQLAAVVFLLIAHTAAFFIYGKSVGVDPWLPGHNVGTFLDQVFGLAASSNGQTSLDILPAAVLVLLGTIAGDMMRGALPPGRKAAVMTATGLALFTLGWALSGGGGWTPIAFPSVAPLSRRMVTASCAVWAAGWIYLLTAACYLITEVMLIRFWTLPFVVVGMNSLFLCVSFRVLEPVVRRSIELVVPTMVASEWQPLLIAGAETLVFWSMCSWLYRKKGFFKA